MSSGIADLLFKEYRRRVLGLLLLHPDRSYHVREIARLTDTVPGTLHKELSKLATAGILTKAHRGNQVTYQANRHSLIYEELASILRKTSGLAEVVADALTPRNNQIEVALIFGSIASGKATESSDIDLLLVGEIDFSEAVKTLHPIQNILGREINPKVYNAREWLKENEENPAFIRELLAKPVINVIGGKDDLRQFARDEFGENRS